MSKLGVVILVGGKSSRMCKNKAHLPLNGKTFLSKILEELEGFEEILLSVDSAEKYRNEGIKTVEDIYPGCGPIVGLYSALSACRSEHILALSCDMPLFQKELGRYMSAFIDDYHDAFVVVARGGRAHPLCAIYGQRARHILEKQIQEGNYRMFDALGKMRVRHIPLQHSVFPDDIVQNVNTPEDYAEIIRRVQGVPIISVCGVKNSGKTTLLTKIIPILKERGLRVAVIKHDGHDFDFDKPGTDSYRIRESGAQSIGIYSPYRYMISAPKTDVTPEYLAKFFDDADIILLEGGKHTAYPKIEVVRKAVSSEPASSAGALIALCSDLDVKIEGVRTLSIDDYDGIVQAIIGYLRKGGFHG